MTQPFCEIVCSPEAARQIGLQRRGWILTKAGFGFENWVLRDEPNRKRILDLKGRDDLVSVRLRGKIKP